MRALLFRVIHILVSRYPRIVVILSILSAALAGYYGTTHMDMITDQDRLLSPELDYHKRYLNFIDRFGDLEYLYVVIEGPTQEGEIEFAESLAKRLQPSDEIKEITYSFDKIWAKKFAFYFADESDIDRLYNELRSNREQIKDLYAYRNVDQILYEISNGLDAFFSENQRAPSNLLEDGDLSTFINVLKGDYEDPFEDFAELEASIDESFEDEKEYIVSGDALLMLVMPAKDYTTLSVIEKPLTRIRYDIWLTEQEFPDVKAGLTGRPALQADEMKTTNDDMQRVSIIALIGVSILFILFFREIGRPVCGILALLMAMGWTYGFVALTLGHLNLLSIVFALVLIGLGIDFGIHFLHRYQEEIKKGDDPSSAIQDALKRVGPGIITGALTSSVAFLFALLTDFLGLAELGYVAGIGIIFCLIAMLITLSALLVSYDRHLRIRETIPTPLHILGLRHVSRYPLIMAILIAIITAILVPKAREVGFDDNLLKLQAEGLESVRYEKKLMDESEYSTWYCAFIKPDLNAVRKTVEQLEKHPLVAKVESLAVALPNIPESQKETIDSAHSLLSELVKNVTAAYYPNPFLRQELVQKINGLFSAISQMSEQKAMMQAQQMRAQQMQAQPMQTTQRNVQSLPDMLVDVDEKLLQQLKELASILSQPDSKVKTKLIQAQTTLFDRPRSSLQSLKEKLDIPPPKPSDLPHNLRSIYIGEDGSHLIMAYPKENIWQTEPMRQFVKAMRSIDPDVTGPPVQVYESSLLMRDAFSSIGFYSFIAVAVLVFIDFWSLRSLFFVMMPLTLGVLWLVELMGVFNLSLNLANFFAIPILIGIGVDNAVHFYHRYLETYDVEQAMYTTGTTLTLTTMTTITGFGSLMFASHKGLASLGALMTMGSATCWFACVVFLPMLIKLFSRRAPWENVS